MVFCMRAFEFGLNLQVWFMLTDSLDPEQQTQPESYMHLACLPPRR